MTRTNEYCSACARFSVNASPKCTAPWLAMQMQAAKVPVVINSIACTYRKEATFVSPWLLYA